MKFNLTGSKNVQRVSSGRVLAGGGLKALDVTAYLLLLIAASALYFSEQISILLNISIFLAGAAILYLMGHFFLKQYYRPKPDLSADNLAEGLSAEMVAVAQEAEKITSQNNLSRVEPIILLAALEKNPDGKYLLLRSGFGLDKDLTPLIQAAIAEIPRSQALVGREQFSPQFVEVMAAAKENAVSAKRDYIGPGDIFIGLIKASDVFKKIMFEIKMEEADLKRVAEWHELLRGYANEAKKSFWEKETIPNAIGRDWSFGYTPTLSQFARNLNEETEYRSEVHIYGRQREVDEIEEVLAKSGNNNVLLVGEHGIGKKTILKGFVAKIVKGQVLAPLRYRQVFQVDTGALLSGAGEAAELAMRVKKIFNEAARAGNIILFFDNFHALVSQKEGMGKANTAEIILPYLAGSVNVIGATTIKDYHKDIEASPGISAAFSKIEVKEPSPDETTQVLEEVIPYIEHRDEVFWPYQAVREAVRVADRYVHNKPFPEKAIEIVDEVSVATAKGGGKIISARKIDELMSGKLEVPIAQAAGEEAKKLLNLEEFLHKRVIGQDEAIAAVSDALRRARSGIQSTKRPIGAFLFLGPTGVGKTETSKALAEAYFGSEKNMLRVDMSEYQEQSSIYRLIGSPPAAGSEGEKGQLTTAVADNPFALILLDEIEKAHRDILTLFLQVFDDGRLTDGTGRVIDFTNTIIIATSNAGSELIRQSLIKGVHGETLKKGLLDFLQKEGIFRPEFLNRFDAIVAFHPLSREQITKVAQLMLTQLSQRMLEKEITLEFKPAAVVKLAAAGFDPVYGARPMRRAIQDKVENVLAKQMLEGKIPRGARVVIDEKDIQ